MDALAGIRREPCAIGDHSRVHVLKGGVDRGGLCVRDLAAAGTGNVRWSGQSGRKSKGGAVSALAFPCQLAKAGNAIPYRFRFDFSLVVWRVVAVVVAAAVNGLQLVDMSSVCP